MGSLLSAQQVATRKLSGAEKVATLLLVMGRPTAARLLKHFDATELRQITRSAADLGSVPAPVIESLVSEFGRSFMAGLDLLASAGEAQQLLAEVLPPEQIADIMKSAMVQILGPELAQPAAPRLAVQATPEGVLISLTDKAEFPMFDRGSAEPQPRVVRMMQKIGAYLKGQPGKIIIRGHTDARPYHSAIYDNWRLSSDRAQIARFMLLRGGIDPQRIDHVEGWADHDLKDPTHPFSAENRRIEILLLKPAPAR